MNSFNFTGRLGQDPELRHGNRDPVCNMSVAMDGAKKDQTIWVRVAIWGKQAEVCAEALRKGSRVAVSARVSEVRAYAKRDGDPGASLEVTASWVDFLDPKEQRNDPPPRYGSGPSGADQEVPF